MARDRLSRFKELAAEFEALTKEIDDIDFTEEPASITTSFGSFQGTYGDSDDGEREVIVHLNLELPGSWFFDLDGSLGSTLRINRYV